MKDKIIKLSILIIVFLCFSFFILYLKPENSSINKHTIQSSSEINIDIKENNDDSHFINDFQNESKKILTKNNEISQSSLFFQKMLSDGYDYESIADMFVTGKIRELGLSEETIQNICNKTHPFVKYDTANILFKNNCKPNDSSASISLINSYLSDDSSVNQKEIIKKLDLYKKYGLLNSNKEYYFGEYREQTNLYEKAVSFGFIEVMDHLENNGLHSQNQNLIDLQIKGRPSLKTINYLIEKGYKVSEKSKEEILNDNKYKEKYPDVYKLIESI